MAQIGVKGGRLSNVTLSYPPNVNTGLRTDTSDPYTAFGYNPGATCQAIILALAHGTESTDLISSVTYGGSSMTRVLSNTDTATEAGRVYLYVVFGTFSGSQSFSVDLTSASGTDIYLAAQGLVSTAGSLSVIDSEGLNDDRANPSVTMQNSTRQAAAFAVSYTGAANPPTAGANCTLIGNNDFTAFGVAAEYQTTPGSADFTIAFSQASDDCAFSAMSIAEPATPAMGFPRKDATFPLRDTDPWSATGWRQ